MSPLVPNSRQLLSFTSFFTISALTYFFFSYVTDAQKDEAILRTFRGVSRHFSEVFAELVPGGAGQLIMRTTMDQDQEGGGAAAGKGKGGKNKKAATAGKLWY